MRTDTPQKTAGDTDSLLEVIELLEQIEVTDELVARNSHRVDTPDNSPLFF